MEELLNGPTGHKPRDPGGQGVPGAKPVYEVSFNIYCLYVAELSYKVQNDHDIHMIAKSRHRMITKTQNYHKQ